MREQGGQQEDRELGERLRREADAPEFSPELHRRIMGALRSASAVREAGRRRVWLRVGWAAAGAAVAAAIIVAVSLKPAGVWPPPRTVPNPSGNMSQIPSLVSVADALVKPAQRQLEEGRYAYLDHDVQKLEHYVLDQLNVP